MGSVARRGWGRRVYLWLTTSPRDKKNRVDDVSGHLQAARRERNHVQRVNDLFHTAGMGVGRPFSREGITLQGRGEGMAWSFVLIPAAFALALLLFISQYRRGERVAEQRAAEAAWQEHLAEVAEKKAAADAALRVALRESAEMQAAMGGLAEEEALTTQLEHNLGFIRERLCLEASQDDETRV